VVEVLLCSARAEELMAGKILGVGAVGLTQVAIWAAFGAMLAFTRPSHSPLAHLPLMFIGYFAIFYLLGYLLYSALFAAVGAAFNSTDEAQHWNFVIISPLIIASLLMTPVANAPNSTFSVIASMVPFCSPVLMYLRMVLDSPPWWQIALSLGLLVGSAYVAVIVSARIYRVGILMYGKRPGVREMMRWMRYA
jgi:ABC-2 type transport system permease protein